MQQAMQSLDFSYKFATQMKTFLTNYKSNLPV